MNKEIGAVIVTFNRMKKLEDTLEAFANQTCKPNYIVVVDNCSNDGTAAFLKKWADIDEGYTKYVITTEHNIGGSGGFYTGLNFAEVLSADWIWVSDDDAIPRISAIDEAHKFLQKNDTYLNSISAICGAVVNDGQYDFGHRKTIYSRGVKSLCENSKQEDYSSDFEINAFSYVGTILNKNKLKEVGLPKRDYFIWYDDTEHSLRLSKVGKIVCIPSIVIDHNVPKDNNEITWKTYYGVRNGLDTMRIHFKQCFYWAVLKELIKGLLNELYRHNLYEKIRLDATLDVLRNRFGLHPVYRPGWKPED